MYSKEQQQTTLSFHDKLTDTLFNLIGDDLDANGWSHYTHSGDYTFEHKGVEMKITLEVIPK